LAPETHGSGEHHYVQDQPEPSTKPVMLRGLNQNHSHDLKDVFKGAATTVSRAAVGFRDFYAALLTKGDEADAVMPAQMQFRARALRSKVTLEIVKNSHFASLQLSPTPMSTTSGTSSG
jgi:hypothetical protein